MLISNSIIQNDMAFEETLLLVIGGAAGAVLSATLPYCYTKKKEMETELRQKKLERYDELLSKFTDFLNVPVDAKAINAFIQAYNGASAYASNDVLKSCHELLETIEKRTIKRAENPNYQLSKDDEEKDTELISNIFMAIRKDVRPNEPAFQFRAFSGKGNK